MEFFNSYIKTIRKIGKAGVFKYMDFRFTFRFLIRGVVIIACILFAYTFYQVGRTAMEYKQRNDLLIASIYEAYTLRNHVITLDTTALNVLCLGNSITIHTPLKGDVPGADSLWRGNWGMCASRPELDYVHRLENMFRYHNKKTNFTTYSLWEWEQNFSINKDSLIGEKCQNKDLIILKIGENVMPEKEPLFQDAFDNLVKYCLQHTPNVIVVGCYWKAPFKEQAMICAAHKYHLPYVPLFWIFDNYHDKVIAHVGDTIYDIQMQPYPIASDFICTHPNDEGMRMISETIFKAVNFGE